MEINIAKSKTSGVKKSHSSLKKKKKKNPSIFFPIQKATSKIIFGSMPLRLFKSLSLLGPYIIPIAPTVSSPPSPFLSNMRKANKPEPSETQISSLVLQLSTNLHTGL